MHTIVVAVETARAGGEWPSGAQSLKLLKTSPTTAAGSKPRDAGCDIARAGRDGAPAGEGRLELADSISRSRHARMPDDSVKQLAALDALATS